jgi:hypothetical protein
MHVRPSRCVHPTHPTARTAPTANRPNRPRWTISYILTLKLALRDCDDVAELHPILSDEEYEVGAVGSWVVGRLVAGG